MRQHLLRFILVILFILAACRDDEAGTPAPDVPGGDTTNLPTAVPTTVVPQIEEAPTGESPATAVPNPTTIPPTPTAVPDPIDAVDPADINWPPQLVYSSPAVGEEVTLNGAITLRFDQPMDKASVEENFVVKTAETDQTTTGTFMWPRPHTIIFTPDSEYEREQKYNVVVAKTAVSSNGLPLPDDIKLQVETVGYLEASQLVPSPKSDGVQTDSAITVLFNRPVVPLVSTGDQAGLPQPLVIEPTIEGLGEWVSTSIYRFVPERPLDGATTYNITIPAGLTDITGGILADELNWSFTTLSPTIVSITPADGSVDIIPDDKMIVTFNMPMNREATESAIRLRGGSTATLNFEWSEDSRTLTLHHPNELDLQTDYRLTIGQLATSANGQATLGIDSTVNFRTIPFPAVRSVTPFDNSVAESWQRGFTVQFASPMDLSSFEDDIRISPEPSSTPRFNFSEWNFELYADFALERNTTYQITIPFSATDPYGNTLGNSYTWEFETPGYDPVASFNLPPQVSQISTDFPSDIDIIHVNTPQFEVNLYEVGLPLNLLSDPFNIFEYNPATQPTRSWSIESVAGEDEATLHTLQLADGGTLPTGVYYLNLNTVADDPNVRYWQNRSHLLVVADTNVVVKEMFDGVYIWVTDITTGQPVAGRSVTIYNEVGAPMTVHETDEEGFTSFGYERTDRFRGITVVSEAPGQPGFGIGRSHWDGNVRPWDMGIEVAHNTEAFQSIYMYTDRPIYRPGDTVHYKGIVRLNSYGRYLAPNRQQTLQLNLNNYSFFGGSGLDETFTVSVTPDGVFSGSYIIPEDVSLGIYQLSTSSNEGDGFRTFTIADYRAPEFLVSVTPDQTEALRGESIEVTVAADYFFGGPATDLPVNYNIYANDFRLTVPNRYYEFGDGASFFYELFGFFGGGPPGLGDFVTSGEGVTDGNGRFTITLPADLLEDFDPGSLSLTVEASIIDLSEFPVTGRTNITMHAADSYVGVQPAKYISTVDTNSTVNLLTTDWAGAPIGNQAVDVVFYRREWESNRTAEFGIYQTRWEPVDTEVSRVQLTTDGQGEGMASFTPNQGGSYMAVAIVTDENGRSHQSSTYLWVADAFYGGWRTDQKERSMSLVADKTEYAIGDTAQILVQSPFDGPITAWLTIERGFFISHEIITLESQSDVIEIPITSDYAPNVHVSIVAVKPVDDSDYPFADIRLGIVELGVETNQLALNIELVPRDTIFAPGDTVTYDVLTTDYAGDPVSADVSLALVDLAVLTLKPDNAEPILEAFYSRQPYRSITGGGLFISGEGVIPEIPVEALGFGGGGGGVADESALARLVSEEGEDVRQDFRDTAFWAAQVVTDINGRATIDIALPDNLTTWRLSSKGITADTLVGQTTVDIVATLPLLLRPITPRFMTVGDVVQLGTVVNNNTDEPIEAVVTLDADGILLEGGAQTVMVPARGQELVRWTAVVQDSSFANLTFRVEGGGFSDATKPTFGEGEENLIPIYRYSAEDVVGTSGVLDGAGQRVEAILLPQNMDRHQGSVDLQLNPSLAAAMLDTLEAENEQQYVTQCAHAAANRLIVNAALARAVHDLALDRPDLILVFNEQIPEAVSHIEAQVLSNGGWGWCYSDEPNTMVTAMVLHALIQSEVAGFVVDNALMDNAATYLTAVIGSMELTNARTVNQQAFYLRVLSEIGITVEKEADNLVENHRDLLSPSSRAQLALVYYFNGSEGENGQLLIDDLNGSAILSATGTHWQADGLTGLWGDIRETAVIIEVLSQVNIDNGLLPGAIRWLIASRRALVWESQTDTAWSVGALTEYMLATGELDADFEYSVSVNGQQWQASNFTRDLILRNELISVPTNRLLLEDVNFFAFEHGGGNGRLYYTMHLNSFIDANSVDAVSRGFTVERTYYDAACDPEAEQCAPITEIDVGQQVRVELNIIVQNNAAQVIISDPIPAGTEAIDPNLETTASNFGSSVTNVGEQYRYGYWGWWYFNRVEFRDEQVRFFANTLPAGTYQYTYYLQATIPGEYQVSPSTARQEFFTEVYGRSAGQVFAILE